MKAIAWMSAPTWHLPAVGNGRMIAPVEHLPYQRIYEAFGRDWLPLPPGPAVPDASPDTAEELALAALLPLLEGHAPTRVDRLVDCRSGAMTSGPAPSYRLALAAGLTAATPTALSGQDGPEIVHAVSVLARSLPHDGTAVVSAVQRVVSPDTRTPAWSSRPLGDAAAAVLVSVEPFPRSRPVLAAVVGPAGRRGDPLARALVLAGLDPLSPYDRVVSDPADAGAHDAYFGVADVLIRLARHDCAHHPLETTVVSVHGRNGTAAALVLGTEHVHVV